MKRLLWIIIAVLFVLLLVACVRKTDEALNESVEESESQAIVAFSPAGLFTSEEREELWERVITPYIDYADCLNGEPASILVEKIDKETIVADTAYMYTVTIMSVAQEGSRDAAVETFIHGETNGEMDYWQPALILARCVDVLPNADELRDQAVDEYRG